MTDDTGAESKADLLRWSADIVSAYVAQNNLPSQSVGDLIKQVHTVFAGLGQDAPEPEPEKRKPAVPIARSIQNDYIVERRRTRGARRLHAPPARPLRPEPRGIPIAAGACPPTTPWSPPSTPNAAPPSPNRSASARASGRRGAG